MAKLTKADVTRHLHISRQTLYEWIGKSRISIGPDGCIDSAEVACLSSSVTNPDVSQERHHGQMVTSPQGDTTRELIEVLKAQLADAQTRERFLQEQVDRLTSIIDRRLLEAPKPAPQSTPHVLFAQSGENSSTRRTHPTAIPATWQAILTYMQQRGTPARIRDVQQALGLPTARYALKRMCDAGLVQRVELGVYQRAAEERSQRRGWRIPPNTVSVGRPSKGSNPSGRGATEE
jgi:hypothetical protein